VRLIRWTTEAADEFEAAVKHIQQDNPTTARKVAQTVIDRIERLPALPGIGRPGEVKGTRDLSALHTSLCTVTLKKLVEVLHIWHGAQDWR
jgi:plasmid stabilization system protein ParE